MNESTQLPTAPATTAADQTVHAPTAARRTWRERLPSGRKAVAAGAVVAGLAIGGAGFGAGYAVGDDGASTGTTQTSDPDFGDRGLPGDGHGPMGDIDGDGDGQPDTDSGSTSDGSATQQS